MVYDPRKSREIKIKGKQVTDAVNAGMRIAKEDLNKPLTSKQLKELQKKQPSTSPYKDYRDYTGKGKGLASLQMHPNLDGIGVHVPTPDDTGASDDYYSTPSDNPNMPYGWQMKITGSPSFDINESSKNRKIRGIRKLQEGGKGGEAGAAGEMLKKLGGPQLPINLAMMNPDAQKALMIKGLKTFQEQGGDALGDFLKKYQQRDPQRPYQPSGSLHTT